MKLALNKSLCIAAVSAFAAAAAALFLGCSQKAGANHINLLNVSFDPTRELYQEINETFRKQWQERTGRTISVQQSHGGSAKQARSVLDGLRADVVTLALGYDIDALHDHGNLVPREWQNRLPENSAPYTSTIVFLVRAGNPENIRDWGDLARSGLAVITPNPKTSGGARWNYLAAWAWALKKFEGDEKRVREFMRALYENVPVFDTGARAALTTFTQRGVGDVLICWESEALLAVKELGSNRVEVVTPSLSIMAEPPVSIVDKVVDRKGTRDAAEAYLQFLYSQEGQEIAARHYYRPRSKEVAAKYRHVFPNLELVTIADSFGGWRNAQNTHFGNGAIFDQISSPTARREDQTRPAARPR